MIDNTLFTVNFAFNRYYLTFHWFHSTFQKVCCEKQVKLKWNGEEDVQTDCPLDILVLQLIDGDNY